MLLVDEIDPGLHVGVPALDQEREFADQRARAKPTAPEEIAARWFPGEDRVLLKVRVDRNAKISRADAGWLDAQESQWPEPTKFGRAK